MSKILLIDLDEARSVFGPAIWGKSDLNENQADRVAKKLVTLLEQRCKVDAIGFEAEVEVNDFYTHREEGVKKRTIEIPGPAIVKMGIPNHGDEFQVFVVKPKKPEAK